MYHPDTKDLGNTDRHRCTDQHRLLSIRLHYTRVGPTRGVSRERETVSLTVVGSLHWYSLVRGVTGRYLCVVLLLYDTVLSTTLKT